jgi:carbonic anhydrase
MRPRPQHLAVLVAVAGLAGGLGYWGATRWVAPADAPPPATPDAALAELRAGNLRFVNSRRTRSTDTAHDAEVRHHTARGQHPFVAVLGCSDSRVCPEFVFDQRPGSIFEIRNAGNVVDEDVLASLEYAVEHLHVPLVVVLGHKGCGAVEAVCAAGDHPLHDHLCALQEHMKGIRPQVLAGNHRHDAEVVDRLAAENARQQALTVLRDSPAIKAAVGRGATRLLYAVYDMETGAVEFSDPGGD